jgi:predicted transcriptional regulator YdeE
MKKIIAFILLLLILIALGYFFIVKKDKSKNDESPNGEIEKVAISEMTLTGISFRTSNNELTETNFSDFQNGMRSYFTISPSINHKTSDNLYVVYTNYENDFSSDVMNKTYSTFIGNSVFEKNEEFDNITIPFQQYVAFEILLDKDVKLEEIQNAVGNKWKEIWGDADLQKNRSFLADFEEHISLENSEEYKIKIYVGIK